MSTFIVALLIWCSIGSHCNEEINSNKVSLHSYGDDLVTNQNYILKRSKRFLPLTVDSFYAIFNAIEMAKNHISEDTSVTVNDDLHIPSRDKVKSSLNEDLVDAAASGQTDAVRSLLEEGADPYVITESWTPLSKATSNGHLDTVKYLIARGVNVNIVNQDGECALHVAAASGQNSIVGELLKYGALKNMGDKDGVTAFHLAAVNGHHEVMETLVKNGVNTNARMANGSTALHLAADRGDLQTVEYLSSTGETPPIAQRNDDLDTPLELAEKRGHDEVAEHLRGHINNINFALVEHALEGKTDDVRLMLLMGADPNTVLLSKTALLNAAANGHLDTIKYLLEKGSYINILNEEGNTNLHEAAWNGKLEAVKHLVQNGAAVNVVNNGDEDTPLKFATWNGHEEIVKYLVDNGAKMDFKDVYGETALTKATYLNYSGIVEFLVEEGADINTIDNEGDSPLIKAANNGFTDIAKYLVQKGADVHHKNNRDKTALSYAKEHGLRELEDFLKSNGAQY